MSNLIKAEFTNPEIAKKVIKLKTLSNTQSFAEMDVKQELLQQAEIVLHDAKTQSEAILFHAQQEYENMLLKVTEERGKWEIEKNQLREETESLGYKDGFLKGKQDGIEQYNEQINFAKEVVIRSKVEAEKYIQASEKTILKLSLRIAEQILKVQLNEDEEVFINIVKQVLKETKEYHDIHLFVHPSKYDLVVGHIDELQAIYNREKNLLIYPDNDISEESCILESSFGRIDASIDSQLSVLKTKLQGLLEEE